VGGLSQSRKAEALRRAPLFEGLSKKDLLELARVTEDFEVPEGTVLCKEGAVGREFFVIVEGTAEVTRGGKPLATRGAGDFVGEIALLTSTRRTATVQATSRLRCLILMRADFQRVLDENRGIERKVTTALAERLAGYVADSAY
jgi:CRP/FNR family transcriptional regulator, cyclic AMP receptor protein